MEIVKLRYESLQKALLTLQKALHIYSTIPKEKPEEECRMLRDSLIQRFEYCIDLFWKFIKLYLEEIKGVSFETTRPKEILRLAREDTITKIEQDILIKAISERNLTSHSYNEEVATEIQNNIPDYFFVMKNIINRIKIE